MSAPTRTIAFSSENYRQLEVLAQTTNTLGEGFPTLTPCPPAAKGQAGPKKWARGKRLPSAGHVSRIVFPLRKWRSYRLRSPGSTLLLAYLTESDDLLGSGIRILTPRPRKPRAPRQSPKLHYAAPGLLERPLGPVRFQGRWHLFYRLAPRRGEARAAFWGHAASLDLVHWTELPLFLPPADGEKSVGEHPLPLAGCLLPVDGEGRACEGDSAAALRFWLVCRQEGRTVLTTLSCFDGIHARGERTVRLAEGAGSRPPIDPKITVPPRGPAIMVDGASLPSSSLPLPHKPGRSDIPLPVRSDGRGGWFAKSPHAARGRVAGRRSEARRPAILTLVNDNPRLPDDRWTATGALLIDSSLGPAGPMDRPDLFPLDGQAVALGTPRDYRDGVGGRFRPVRWYEGNLWKGTRVNGQPAPRLLVRNAGWLDFGTALSQARTFRDGRRRLLIGRVTDFYERDPDSWAGACTLPRVLTVRNGRLFEHPPLEVYAHALGNILTQMAVPSLADSPLAQGVRLDIPSNAYYADLRLTAPSRYDRVRLTLGRWGSGGAHSLALTNTLPDGFTRFSLHGVDALSGVDPVSTIARGRLQRVEIFYDRGIAEVFLNDGEAVGTVLVPDPRREGGVLEASLPRGSQLTVRTLEGR